MNEKKSVLKQTLIFALGILAGSVIMVLVYLLLDKFTTGVIIGALVGTLVSVGNFFFMCISLTNTANSEVDPNVAANKARGGYVLRMLVVAVILVVAIKSGYCDTLATVIPLLLVRPVLMLEEFFIKNGDKK